MYINILSKFGAVFLVLLLSILPLIAVFGLTTPLKNKVWLKIGLLLSVLKQILWKFSDKFCFVPNWIFYFLQVKNLINAHGKDVLGNLPDLTNWHVTTASTPGTNPFNADNASARSLDPTTWRCTWSDTNLLPHNFISFVDFLQFVLVVLPCVFFVIFGADIRTLEGLLLGMIVYILNQKKKCKSKQ